jgi:hypothetical protein
MSDVPPTPPGLTGDDDDGGGFPLEQAALAVAGAGVVLAAAAAYAFGAFEARSVALGAGLMAADVYVLGRVIRVFFGGPESDTAGSSRTFWGFVGFAKLFLLFGGVWWLMSANLVDPLGLAAGIAALPIGLGVTAFSSSARMATARKNRGNGPPPSARD